MFELKNLKAIFTKETSPKIFLNFVNNGDEQNIGDDFFGYQTVKPRNDDTIGPKPSNKGRISCWWSGNRSIN